MSVLFYEHGCKVSDISETRKNYFSNMNFPLDIISILPTDLFLFLQFDASVFRLNRLLKCYRLFELFDLAQGRLRQVIISLLKIVISCTLIFHWNACAFYIISKFSDTTSWDGVNATFDDDEGWPWPYMPDKITNVHFVDCFNFEQNCEHHPIFIDEEREAHLVDLWRFWENKTIRIDFSTFTKAYVLSMYWSALTMTTLGEQPAPNETMQTVFEILDTVIGMVLFAGIMGSVGDLVAKANKVKADWQQRMDGLKQFMTYR
nr:Ion transport domain containing protein [Haemonchus contortus]